MALAAGVTLDVSYAAVARGKSEGGASDQAGRATEARLQAAPAHGQEKGGGGALVGAPAELPSPSAVSQGD